MHDLRVDERWTTSSDGDRLLIYDNDVESTDRMLVFETDDGLRHLASSELWFVDGTFSPQFFSLSYI